MLLQEQMKQDIFSYNEKTIIDFILEKQEQIKDYSTKMIGDETYTAPSTIIRIAHKLGFQGWSDFKESFLDEVIYLNNNFQEIDPNFPFTKFKLSLCFNTIIADNIFSYNKKLKRFRYFVFRRKALTT